MGYVGDWNNHKNLNPLIQDWSIENIDIESSDQVKKTFDLYSCPIFVIPLNLICDQGILRRYCLSYTEQYEHIPWLTNTAKGLVTLTHGDKVLNTPHRL